MRVVCGRNQRHRGGPTPKPSSLREMSEVDAAWIGAMVEGEGCITNTPSNYTFPYRLVVCSTSVETIATLLRLTAVGTIHTRPSKPGYKSLWVWSVDRQNDIRALLRYISPYLTDKQDLANAALKARYRNGSTSDG